jgi:hypothetical protein
MVSGVVPGVCEQHVFPPLKNSFTCLAACVFFLFFSNLICIPTPLLLMQFNSFNNYDDLGQGINGLLSPTLAPLGFNTNKSNFGDFGVDTLRGPRRLLRSRPAIDFSGQHPTLPPSQPPSLISGSMLHSTSNPFPCKAVSTDFFHNSPLRPLQHSLSLSYITTPTSRSYTNNMTMCLEPLQCTGTESAQSLML